jgi:hypothetical protein
VHAREAKSTRAIAIAWARAEQHWSRYVNESRADDRYLPLAKHHLAQARARRVAAEKRVAAEPQAPALPDPNILQWPQ